MGPPGPYGVGGMGEALFYKSGLLLNAVWVFENARLCSVFCLVFESERVRLNVFGLSERSFGLRCKHPSPLRPDPL